MIFQDDNGACIVSQGKLVGITSAYSSKRPATFTKIYNFLPFIIFWLKEDPVVGRYPVYNADFWIHDALNLPILSKKLPYVVL